MESVRRIIDSTLLNGVIQLPKGFKNKKVEIIVFHKDDKTDLPILTSRDIDAMLKGSITESLIGAIPQLTMTLEDYRAERLAKYGSLN